MERPRAARPRHGSSSPALQERAARVRGFNRFYTRHIGALEKGFLGTRFSLTEARVLYELAQRDGLTATSLAQGLGLDSGYLSRLLKGFDKAGLVERPRAARDRRRRPLRLTRTGRRAFAVLDRRSERQIEESLQRLPEGRQAELVRSMRSIEEGLGARTPDPVFILRDPRPGDFGWVVARHGAIYAEEYGWDETFEGLVAQIVSDFSRSARKPGHRCWIAERDGDNVGCVFVVRRRARVGQLRLLLVEATGRGHGLGGRLVDECVRFARQAGYRKLMLWTNSVLRDAARLYRRAGFRMVAEEKHRSFGQALVGQTWELDLRAPRA